MGIRGDETVPRLFAFGCTRNFGCLHPNCKRLLALLHVPLTTAPGQATASINEQAPILCAYLGSIMVIVKTPIRSVFYEAVPVRIVTRGSFDQASAAAFFAVMGW